MPKGNPFELPDDQCERVTRTEMASCRTILLLASDLHHAQEDLKDRLKCVPYGERRLRMISGGIDSLFRDILGTITDKQRKQIRNQAKDLVMQAVPKLTASQNKVMVYLDDIKELTNCAMERCKRCADTGDEARKCRLYQWLETNIPLDDYGDNLICPYARIGWGDEDE